MNLPKWCQTHSLMKFLQLIEFGSFDPKKGKKMNALNTEKVDLPVDINTVVVDTDIPAELRKIAEELDANGEVLVQTAEVAGNEIVH